MEIEPLQVSTKSFARLVASHTAEQIGAVFDKLLAGFHADPVLARLGRTVAADEMWTRVLVICLAAGLLGDLPVLLAEAGFSDECVAGATSETRNEEMFLWVAHLAMMSPNGLSFEQNVPVALTRVFDK